MRSQRFTEIYFANDRITAVNFQMEHRNILKLVPTDENKHKGSRMKKTITVIKVSGMNTFLRIV